jgi:hypothetical protein
MPQCAKSQRAPFFQDVYFEPDVIEAMGAAFEKACRSLNGSAQSDLLREMVAKGIIEAARGGERDPDQLCDETLKALGFVSPN